MPLDIVSNKDVYYTLDNGSGCWRRWLLGKSYSFYMLTTWFKTSKMIILLP